MEGAEPPWSIDMAGLPVGDDFVRYLRQWLVSPTNEDCPLGGAASYADAVSLGKHDVRASHVRTYHTPLKAQRVYINAYEAAHLLAAEMSTETKAAIIPYSVFYVFFEQYATIVATTRTVLALALAAVFLVTSALLGSWRTGAVVGVTVLMSLVSVMGIMGAWGVSLNALSLVNLVIAVGIAVEFCAHIARAFMGAGGGGLPHDHPNGPKERDERAWIALVDVGSSVR
jgi:Niemann-Pick C1 protein